jgi:hypothetical protein
VDDSDQQSDVERVSQDRVWWLLRSLERDSLMVIAARALLEVPVRELERVLRGYARPEDVLCRSGEQAPSLLAAVERFCNHARQGHFYEDSGSSEPSNTTQEFVGRCRMLFDRALTEGARGAPEELRGALELLFGLMQEIAEEPDMLVHFPPAAGIESLGIDWQRVAPAYFRAVARSGSEPELDQALERLTAIIPGELSRAELQSLARDAWQVRQLN